MRHILIGLLLASCAPRSEAPRAPRSLGGPGPGEGQGGSGGRRAERAVAAFAVHCYDVGRAAAEAMPGVEKVWSGFRGFEEVNEVTFDPARVTVAELEDAIRRSGTLKRRIEKN